MIEHQIDIPTRDGRIAAFITYPEHNLA